jgi:hypothetical protein
MRRVFAPLAASLLFLLCAGAARAQGALLVVDAAGGAGSAFTSIGAAVDVAADGDVLLVRTGSYAPFILNGKTLIIMAAPGAEVSVTNSVGTGSQPAITVWNIDPNQAVVLEGLSIDGIEGPGTDGSPGLSVSDCGGQVWVQDCEIVGGSDGFWPQSGALVADCDQVMFVNCTVTGSSLLSDLFQPVSAGLRTIDSRVFAWDCEFTGGFGGPGAQVDGREFFAEDSVLTGGQGQGIFLFTFCDLAVDGGPGLKLLQQGEATLVNSHTIGGAGDPDSPDCSDPGPPVDSFFGTVTQLPGPTMDFSATSPVADGLDARLDVASQPGDVPVVLMALSLGPAAFYPKYKGALVSGNAVLFVLSPLPASGEASVAFGFGDSLPPGTGSTIFLQGAVLKAGGGALLGDAAVLTTFDD